MVGKTALWHTLGMSETASKWDLKTELLVNVIRSFVATPNPSSISKAQRVSLKDPGIKGKMWISKVTLPAPEEYSLRQCLIQAIESLKEPGQAEGGFPQPDYHNVEAEWTGHREGVAKNVPLPDITEAEKYEALMKEVTAPTTVLYFHGGAYYLMDPCSHRAVTSKLAKLTKGRCLSVRYRLAPQHPFPAALLDALVSYLNLLYPSKGSLHPAVDPKHIVFSGDSAGGNLSVALLQTLLQFQRMNLKIKWNGEERSIPLPAGVALNSPWMDITHSSPSCDTNAKYDYLPHRSMHPSGATYPACSIWPASPPRKTLYATDAVLCHPLVSPMAAEDWSGSPPIWIVTGEELLSDEDKYFAKVLASQGVTVLYDEFEAMPHCFAMVLEGHEGGRRCFTLWSGFIKAAVEDPASLKTRGTKHAAKTLKEETVDLATVSPFAREEVLERMKARVEVLSPQQPDTLAKL